MADKEKDKKPAKDAKASKGGAPKAEAGGAGDKKKARGKDAAAAGASGAGAAGAPRAEAPARPVPPPRLKKIYHEQVVPALVKRFSYSNRMQAPRLVKIVVNMGVGEARQNAK